MTVIYVCAAVVTIIVGGKQIIEHICEFFDDPEDAPTSPDPEPDPEELVCREPRPEELQCRADPQMAFLINRFEVEGEDILDDLINEATRPENVVLETRLHHFLGGANFIASSAFSGSLLDSDGNVIRGSSVGFGVFEKDDGDRIFSIIQFAPSFPDLHRAREMKLDFAPLEAEGSFEAEVQQAVEAFDPDDESPSCSLTEATKNSVDITIQDTGSGLSFIEITGGTNVKNVVQPSFLVGSLQQVLFSATKRDRSEESNIELRVFDVAGNVTECGADF